MTLEEVKKRAQLPPPEAENHPGPPPGWVPPPPPPEMEPECEAVIAGAIYADGAEMIRQVEKISGEGLCGITVESDRDNESAIYARGGAKITVERSLLRKTGGALVRQIVDADGNQTGMLPMLRGINSTVLANGPDTVVTLKDCRIEVPCTPGDMALEASNGVFTVFRGKAYLERVNIELDSGFGHGLYDSQFGAIYADQCRVVTTGHCASALATDQPGGDLFITNTTALCRGPASAGVYVDGGSHAELYGCNLRSVQDAGAALCNDGYLGITDSVLRGALAAKLWQPVEEPGLMELTRCTLISDEDAAYIFDGGHGKVVMDACTLVPAPGQCAIECRRCEHHYDHIGNGEAVLKNCTLVGDIAATDDCSLKVELENTTVEGRFYNVDLKVGYGSRVVFTGDSELCGLEVAELGALRTVKPCVITYAPKAGGISGVHTLPGGGVLTPKENGG